jgi:hypothetical protein
MSTRIPTSSELETRVVELYLAGEGKASIRSQTGVSAWVLYRILDDHGVKRRPRGTRSKSRRFRWSDDQLREMCEARERLPVAVVEQMYGMDDTTLWRHAKRLGYGSKRQKLPWDQLFFARNSATVAYWAGFLMADGCVTVRSPRSTQLTLGLSELDRGHLEAFREALNSEHAIQERPGTVVNVGGRTGHSRPHVTLTVSGDGSLATDLRRWGIVPNKTRNWVEPDVPRRLLRHYLRGWFDGDGTLSFHDIRNQYFKVTGHREALRWYLRQLQGLGHPGDAYFTKSPPASVACDMRINGRWQVLRIAGLLYRKGDLCLGRKWVIAHNSDWRRRGHVLRFRRR